MKLKSMSAILLLLIITFSMLLISTVPSANAAVVIRNPFTVFAYVSAMPNPVGVGQTVLVTFRIDQPLSGATIRSGLANGTTVTISKPDGTTETKGPYTLDSTSSGWFAYVPAQTGTYTFQMHFPQQKYWINTTTTQTQWTYNADDSDRVSLTVQQDPIQGYDRSPPLPTDSWTRPINAENKGWWQVADNWLMAQYDKYSRAFSGATAYAMYTSAPDSAHVLWTKEVIPGGIVGGPFGDATYYTGISYEQQFTAMIIDGVIFNTQTALTSTSPAWGTAFYDLYTGEELKDMFLENVTINFAQVLEYDSGNEHGALPYLWAVSGSTWYMYDFIKGEQPHLRVTLTGMTGLTNTAAFEFGPKGEILSIVMGGNATHRWLSMFNSTRAILGLETATGAIDTWSPSVGTINASRSLGTSPGGSANAALAQSKSHSPFMGIEWNVTVPDVEGVTQIIGASFSSVGTGLMNYKEGWLLSGIADTSQYPYVYSDVGYDISQILENKAADGTYPASIPHSFAANRTMIHDIHGRYSTHIRDGKYIRFDEGEEVFYCFSMQTGALLWQSDPIGNAWACFTRNYELADGKLVATGFDGYVRCYDLNTGENLWNYYKGSAGFENAYGTYPEYAGFTIADGKVFTTADEHSSDAVIWRGAQMWAIDLETGQLVWKVNGMYRHPIVADGILVALNSYDGQVYAFGKGTSETGVTAPQVGVTVGSPVMISGLVTDQTEVSKDTAAISDESMGLWMEYMHMQKVFPNNATGVTVTVSAVGSDGTEQTIGTTTTDLAGNFGISWTPTTEGDYQITATFAGTESYGSSFSTAYMVVGAEQKAEPTTTPTQTTAPTQVPTTAAPTTSPSAIVEPGSGVSTETLLIAAAAAIIIIAVIAAAIALRKRN